MAVGVNCVHRGKQETVRIRKRIHATNAKLEKRRKHWVHPHVHSVILEKKAQYRANATIVMLVNIKVI